LKQGTAVAQKPRRQSTTVVLEVRVVRWEESSSAQGSHVVGHDDGIVVLPKVAHKGTGLLAVVLGRAGQPPGHHGGVDKNGGTKQRGGGGGGVLLVGGAGGGSVVDAQVSTVGGLSASNAAQGTA